MTYAAFRTSGKLYRSRPAANCRAARWAWDFLAARGEIESMRLLDGLWMCERPGDDSLFDCIEAGFVRQRTATNA